MKNLMIWISLAVCLLVTQNVCDCKPIPDMIGVISGLISMHSNLKEIINDDQMKNSLPDMLLTSVSDQLQHWKMSSRYEFRNFFAGESFEKLMVATSQIEDFYDDMKSSNGSTTYFNVTDRMIRESQSTLSPKRDRPIALIREILYYLNFKENNILNSLKRQCQRDYVGTCLTEATEDPIPKHLLDFMSMIVAIELKVFLTVQMAAGILKYSNAELDFHNKILEENHKSITIRFKNVITTASRDVWRCDPIEHVEGVTYTKLNNVFRKFVVNERSFHDNYGCSKDCRPEFPQNVTYCSPGPEYTHIIQEEFCTHQPVCEGLLQDCGSGFDINAIDTVQVYLSANRSLRYDCIEIQRIGEVRKHYGLGCPSRTPLSFKLDYTYFFYKCDVCLCTCDEYQSSKREENHSTERFFYTRPVFADTKNDYVITGTRIAKKDGVVFIQIQQGKLQKQCSIDASTVSWQTTPRDLNESMFHSTMRWTGIRSIELKDIDVPVGHILVGLRIGEIEVPEKRLRLEVYSLPVGYTNGCTLLSNEKPLETTSSSPKSILDLEEKYLPNPREQSNSTVTEKYVKFTTSSMFSDVGQTTVPLLDIQNVITSTPLPMSGAGFYFKYTNDYQGYLGLKLKLYDFSQNLKVDEKNMSNTNLWT